VEDFKRALGAEGVPVYVRRPRGRDIFANSGQWTVNSEQWTVDSGQWTVDSGTVDSEQWTVDNSGQWTVNSGQWTVNSEQSGRQGTVNSEQATDNRIGSTRSQGPWILVLVPDRPELVRHVFDSGTFPDVLYE
jgi:hypothetical protein